MSNQTIIKCSNCGKELLPGDREWCEKHNQSECTECTYLQLIDARTIDKYNAWLRKQAPKAAPYLAVVLAVYLCILAPLLYQSVTLPCYVMPDGNVWCATVQVYLPVAMQ